MSPLTQPLLKLGMILWRRLTVSIHNNNLTAALSPRWILLQCCPFRLFPAPRKTSKNGLEYVSRNAFTRSSVDPAACEYDQAEAGPFFSLIQMWIEGLWRASDLRVFNSSLYVALKICINYIFSCKVTISLSFYKSRCYYWGNAIEFFPFENMLIIPIAFLSSEFVSVRSSSVRDKPLIFQSVRLMMRWNFHMPVQRCIARAQRKLLFA